VGKCVILKLLNRHGLQPSSASAERARRSQIRASKGELVSCVLIKYRNYRQNISVFIEKVACSYSARGCRWFPPENSNSQIVWCVQNDLVHLIQELLLSLGSLREWSRFFPVFRWGGTISHLNKKYRFLIWHKRLQEVPTRRICNPFR